MKKILVTAKVNPDLDGAACTLAYSDLINKLGGNVEGVIFGSPQSEVRYFIEKHNIDINSKQDVKSDNWNEFVLVDASSMKGMPSSVVSDKVIEIIDHRKGKPEQEFPGVKIQNELIGAAATIVVERYRKAKQKPEPNHAKLLYGAIYHNTLNFIAFNSTARDQEAADYLEKLFGFEKSMIRDMFDFATEIIESDIKQALEDDAKEFGSGFKIGAYQLVVWGSGVKNKGKEIELGVDELSKKLQANWAFLNLIDLENRKSNIFCKNPNGQQVLQKAIGCNFSNNWCELDKAWLRKQIMPKVNDVVGKS
jgi:inorganic pyrophosphatase/exopolyphosphatase